MMMYKNLSYTSILGCLTIILGAFGAHKLKEILSVGQLESYETAVRYMFYHVLLLFFINSNIGLEKKHQNRISLMILVGVLLFSGSIFTMTLTNIEAKKIAFLTPIGGMILIISWLRLAFLFYNKSRK